MRDPKPCPDCGLPLLYFGWSADAHRRAAHADRHLTLQRMERAISELHSVGWDDLATEASKRYESVRRIPHRECKAA